MLIWVIAVMSLLGADCGTTANKLQEYKRESLGFEKTESNRNEIAQSRTQQGIEYDALIQRDPLQPVLRVKRSADSEIAERVHDNEMRPVLRNIVNQQVPQRKRARQGDAAKGYHSHLSHQPAPVANVYSNYFTISLPVFIVWGMFIMFCVFGLRPSGAICRWIFAPRSDPLTRMV